MKILLAVDDSKYSDAAIREVMKRPWPAKSTIRVVTVAEKLPPPAAELWIDAHGSLEAAEGQVHEHAAKISKKAAAKLGGKGVKIESVTRDGNPRSAIVDEAERWKADLIVVGSHGRTGVTRLLIGSVAQSVVSHAPCSVEVVRKRTRKA